MVLSNLRTSINRDDTGRGIDLSPATIREKTPPKATLRRWKRELFATGSKMISRKLKVINQRSVQIRRGSVARSPHKFTHKRSADPRIPRSTTHKSLDLFLAVSSPHNCFGKRHTEHGTELFFVMRMMERMFVDSDTDYLLFHGVSAWLSLNLQK